MYEVGVAVPFPEVAPEAVISEVTQGLAGGWRSWNLNLGGSTGSGLNAWVHILMPPFTLAVWP